MLLILAPKSVIKLGKVVFFNCITLSLWHIDIQAGNSRQLLTTKCVCPETLTTFQCTVTGSGTTVWRGSAFSCDNTGDGTLQLRHSQFASGSLVRECNSTDSRMIMAHEVDATGNNYTSQLIIPVTPEIDNKTVECVHDDGTTIRVISASTVDITSISGAIP